MLDFDKLALGDMPDEQITLAKNQLVNPNEEDVSFAEQANRATVSCTPEIEYDVPTRVFPPYSE